MVGDQPKVKSGMSESSATEFAVDRSKLVDGRGHPLTQALFLEVGYGDAAIYTLKEEDYEYEGKMYPSLKRLYIRESDPTEYQFAVKYLLNWKQWQRLCENKLTRKHIDEWREELEVKLRCAAVQELIKDSKKGKILASKWLADRGWAQRGAGRPSKADVESEKVFQSRVSEEYGADVIRLRAD
jgi:hypothetical protein